MKNIGKVLFKGWECDVLISDSKRPAIMLVDSNDGEPVTKCTVNLPHEVCMIDEVFIKNYSENEGILEVLINAGIISAPRRIIKSGYVAIPVCDLLIK